MIYGVLDNFHRGTIITNFLFFQKYARRYIIFHANGQTLCTTFYRLFFFYIYLTVDFEHPAFLAHETLSDSF